MELFIRLKNGAPFEHPILGNNFRAAFPDVDVNNLPPHFARFERVPCPALGVYEVNDGLTYELIDGIVKDVWHIRPMTPEEKQQKIDFVKNSCPYASWTFDEERCAMVPPFPRPDGVKRYFWDEPTVSWKEEQ